MVAELHSLISKESEKPQEDTIPGLSLSPRNAAAERSDVSLLKPKETSVNPKDRPWMLLALLHLQAPRKMLREKGRGAASRPSCTACAASANPFSSGPRHMVASPHLLTQYPGRAHRTYFPSPFPSTPIPSGLSPIAQPLPHLVTHFPRPSSSF